MRHWTNNPLLIVLALFAAWDIVSLIYQWLN